MTKEQTQTLLETIASGMVDTALKLRVGRPDSVLPILALAGRTGHVAFHGIRHELMPHRVEVIRDLVQRTGSVGFAFLYDGFVSQMCTCPNLSGCENCDPPGRVRGTRREAIHCNAFTAWGWKRVFTQPYEETLTGQIVKLPYDTSQATNIVLPYDEIFHPAPRPS